MIQFNDVIRENAQGSIAPIIRKCLLHLWEASELARDAGLDVWEFATEITSLQHLGVHTGQLRWLVCKDFVEHARETTLSGACQRSFEPIETLSISQNSCFVLTDTGEAYANTLRDGFTEFPTNAVEDSVDAIPFPVWDADLRELRFQSQVVKRYKVPSPNQLMVLSAFEEEGWPCRVDDPLPNHPSLDPKRRLHDTIKSLNKHQLAPLLRFNGDGTGEGVRWKCVDEKV